MIRNFSAYRQVMNDAKLPRAKLDQLVRKRLRNVLTSAYRNVSYYREMMLNMGYNPIRDYHGPEDLLGFPVTTKRVLNHRGKSALTNSKSDLSNCFSQTTSGSTGIPLTIYKTPYERSITIAKWLRVLFLNGYTFRQKVMEIGRVQDLDEDKSVLQHLGFLRRLNVDRLLPMEKIADRLLEYEPDVLYCIRTHLELLAYELKHRGIKPGSLKLVFSFGEIIYEHTRQLCRNYLGIELIENYGSVEMGAMAYETPKRDGLRLSEDLTYFEFLNEDGNPVAPGEPGRVIVTDLICKLMPLIRYDQGDRAVFQNVEDDDGEVSRRLTQIIGRDDDLIVMPDGSKHRHNVFNPILRGYSNIYQYRIIQRSLSFFDIFIAADDAYLVTIHDEILQNLKNEFPPGVKFEIKQVDQINPDPSGKLRKFVSEVRT